ncbi:MAG: AmmeMemoRadiSam system protein A [Dechloromonas sp.]|nr:AmmeMemoRadiSam system protein A [Dechloromonas sp.]
MPDLGDALLILARNAIASQLGQAARPTDDLPALREPGATFVTLTQQGQLRGCIGSLEAWRPLGVDVRENALAAAFRDPRFPPLVAAELPLTRVEVSLLTPAIALPFTDEADALAQLRPGEDGIIFSCGSRRATFLPQVWEQLPDPALFMAHLKQKAGLPAAYWGPDVRLERYGVTKWKEASP